MPTNLQPQNHFGHILMTDGGNIAGECCCTETATNPCGSTNCTSQGVSIQCPSINLTVSGASGTINWCGQTWVLPGESGATKTACPQAHTKRYGTDSTYYYYALHTWRASGNGLTFQRQYSGTFNSPTLSCFAIQDWLNQMRVQTAFGNNFYKDAPPLTTTLCGTFIYKPRPIQTDGVDTSGNATLIAKCAVGAPRPPAYGDDYHIPDSMLTGSIVLGGITYAWAKGLGW